MLTLVKKTIEFSEYKEVFEKVFGCWTLEDNCPSTVYYAYEDEALIGLMSGYVQSPVSFYLQRTGFLIILQKSVRNLNRMRQGMAQLHREWPVVTSTIASDDVTMLKMALMVGFKIRGSRIGPDNSFWVEMISKREGC